MSRVGELLLLDHLEGRGELHASAASFVQQAEGLMLPDPERGVP